VVRTRGGWCEDPNAVVWAWELWNLTASMGVRRSARARGGWYEDLAPRRVPGAKAAGLTTKAG